MALMLRAYCMRDVNTERSVGPFFRSAVLSAFVPCWLAFSGLAVAQSRSLAPALPDLECKDESGSSAFELERDPVGARLLRIRAKQAYEACMGLRERMADYARQEKAEQWRRYGSVRISWSSWKREPDSSVRTGKASSRCWFDVVNPAAAKGAGADNVEFQWSDCPVDWEDAEATVAVDCHRLRTRVSLVTWRGSWSTWRDPAAGSPEENLVLDLCRNAI